MSVACLLSRKRAYRTVAYQRTSASVRRCGNVCLANRWLAVDLRSSSTIPAFRRHVTVTELVVWIIFLLEKLTRTQPVNSFPPFMKLEQSLLSSQMPFTGLYSNTDTSSLQAHSYLHFNRIFPSTSRSPKWFYPSVFRRRFLMQYNLSHACYMFPHLTSFIGALVHKMLNTRPTNQNHALSTVITIRVNSSILYYSRTYSTA
jgi:hypothetical protein